MSAAVCVSVSDADEALCVWVDALKPGRIGKKRGEMTPAEDLARFLAWRRWDELAARRLCGREVRS